MDNMLNIFGFTLVIDFGWILNIILWILGIFVVLWIIGTIDESLSAYFSPIRRAERKREREIAQQKYREEQERIKKATPKGSWKKNFLVFLLVLFLAFLPGLILIIVYSIDK